MAGEPFSYAILRLVPDVERGECFNVGVVLFCRQRRYLGIRVALDHDRLLRFAPDVPTADLTAHLQSMIAVAHGDPAAGDVARLEPSERFGWLAAPSSTVVQASAVHTGISDDPERTLDALFLRLVA